MQVIKTKIDGVFLIKNNIFTDERGKFIKTFNEEKFIKSGLQNIFKESYYSVSQKNVIRGMHFQLPPHAHEKLVYVTKGKVIDIVLDLRKNSETKGQFIEVELTGENGYAVYMPQGVAHGFKSLEDETIMVYNVATVYNQDKDFGIRYDSFGYDWKSENCIISKRDKEFESLEKFLEREMF